MHKTHVRWQKSKANQKNFVTQPDMSRGLKNNIRQTIPSNVQVLWLNKTK